ncbi:NET1-associated nuclear protein 1 [Ophidiomyces ophidiicola]|nr:NET1-associated nuclear protein 1 [Ophidiomyces ophidiicola]KAI2011277.1 NET1-associated nuclear protein 1 [Ophidiomyces ophidiicola]KAI2133575.1 NET1-associated nuclear protein 1 [Ophidiomyces ophidiicola]KAI2425596.1 NET1-associated nuclear protein 1 [Ophidiomyces ophidiicola]KAI2436588.1 NET1-associated nuclear protein 1 [Ophidiomyces ophidiicola]
MKGKRALRPDASPDRDVKRIKHNGAVGILTTSASPQDLSIPTTKLEVPSTLRRSSKRNKPNIPSVLATCPQEIQPYQDQWTISCRGGGRISNIDPVFSPDEKYILIPHSNIIQIYSMTTSSIVRTLQTPDNLNYIIRHKISPIDPHHLFVATHCGTIIEWDWTTGKLIQLYELSTVVVSFDVISVTTHDPKLHDALNLYTICKNKEGKYEIRVSVEDHDSDSRLWKHSAIYTTSTRISNLRIAAGGRVILAFAGVYVVAGYCHDLMPGALGPSKHSWREVRLSVYATCYDIWETSRQKKSHNKIETQPLVPAIDLAVGDEDGAILIYHDFITTLLNCEKEEELDTGLVSRRLHWHRDTVKTVKWSKDGNYIISGGLETVLVLWQLDAGRQQFLPHLTSPICNLVVSPSGASYAVKLADNSAMVLSTSELKPTASMSSLQIPFYNDISNHHSKKKKSNNLDERRLFLNKIPAAINPISGHLLLAVPSSQTTSSPDRPPNASFLQTFDIRSNQHISRQAIARTNVSIMNSGPEGTGLTTPNSKFIQISFDGDWLVTVDEWDQYIDTVNILTPLREVLDPCKRRETFLKFWRWSECCGEWELVTRVDNPHGSPLYGSLPIRDLVMCPSRLAVATVGDDGAVKIWTPEYKRDASKRSIKTWKCSQTIALDKLKNESEQLPQTRSCLSFSGDGSILAVCWAKLSSSEPGIVFLIDPIDGRICYSRQNLFYGLPRDCGFVDRYLIILSDHLVSWHTVTDKISFVLSLTDKTGSQSYAKSAPLLALDHRNQTFAVAFPKTISYSEETPTESEKTQFQIAIFKPTAPGALFQSKLESAPRALMAGSKTGDYTIINSAAEVIQVSSSTQTGPVTADMSSTETLLRSGLEDLFGFRQLPLQSGQGQPASSLVALDHAKSLADIFDTGPSFALPDIEILLRDVVDVFSSRTVPA